MMTKTVTITRRRPETAPRRRSARTTSYPRQLTIVLATLTCAALNAASTVKAIAVNLLSNVIAATDTPAKRRRLVRRVDHMAHRVVLELVFVSLCIAGFLAAMTIGCISIGWVLENCTTTY